MNDDFADFENELRELRPASLSGPLQRRVAAILDAVAPHSWWQRIGFNRLSAAICWGLLSPGLTAAIVLVVTQVAGFHRLPAKPEVSFAGRTAQTPADETVRATNVLNGTQDDGVVLDSSQVPVHRVRYRSTDLVQWRNPNTGARWEVSYPREDVALMPIHIN